MTDENGRDAGCIRTATLDLASCMACGEICEVTGTFSMPGPDRGERYVRTRCVLGHLMMGPEFALRPAGG